MPVPVSYTHLDVYKRQGEGDYQFITPLDLPIKALMEKLGVKVERKTVKFDFKKKISSSINAHTH